MMAGVHFCWRKRAFRAQWALRGAPGCAGTIVATREAPNTTTAYVWSVRSGPSGAAGGPLASGVAATLSDARLLASRAVFAAIRTPAEHPELGRAWTRHAVADR